MTILHPTRKLARRLPPSLVESSASVATNKLGPWSANIFNVGRSQFVIVTNELTLLTVVVKAKPPVSLWDNTLSSLRTVFEWIEIPRPVFEKELAEMQEVKLVRGGTNRSVLGSMNEFILSTRVYLDFHEEASLEDINLHLNDSISLALKNDLYPREAARRVLLSNAATL